MQTVGMLSFFLKEDAERENKEGSVTWKYFMSSIETYSEIGITVENRVTAVRNNNNPTIGRLAGLKRTLEDTGSADDPNSKYQYFCNTQSYITWYTSCNELISLITVAITSCIVFEGNFKSLECRIKHYDDEIWYEDQKFIGYKTFQYRMMRSVKQVDFPKWSTEAFGDMTKCSWVIL